MSEDVLPLEAEITVSQLREDEALGKVLARYHRVRLRRYSDLVGVVVDTGEWRRLTDLIASLQDRLAVYEENELRALIRYRAGEAVLEPGHPGRTAAIFDDIENEAVRAGERH